MNKDKPPSDFSAPGVDIVVRAFSLGPQQHHANDDVVFSPSSQVIKRGNMLYVESLHRQHVREHKLPVIPKYR